MKRTILLILLLLSLSIHVDAKKLYRSKLSTKIENAIKTHAIDKRKSKLALYCIVTFDGKTDGHGNEIFRVDMTINPFSIHKEDEYTSYAKIGTCTVYIKGNNRNKRHTTKMEGEWFEIENSLVDNGINVYNTTPPESYYFVITDDEVLPYQPETKTE